MKIQEKIKIDIKKSVIGRHPDRTTLLRTVIGELDRKGKDVEQSQVLSLIKKMREDAKSMNNQFEVDVLSEYLPTDLTPNEITNAIQEILNENTYTVREIGVVMGKLKSKYGTRVNMKFASTEVKNLLK